MGISLVQKGARLYMQGTLPPRPGSGRVARYQQKIAVTAVAPWVQVNPAGVRRAEVEARKLSDALVTNRFDWLDYLPAEEKPKLAYVPASEWVEKFRADYFERRSTTSQALTTWSSNYMEVFKRLPRDEELTAEVIKSLVLTTMPDSRTRQRYCLALKALAKYAGVEVIDLDRLRGEYSPRRVSPCQLPTDTQIRAWYDTLKHPGWRWVYGILSTYGLRPHEVYLPRHRDFAQWGADY